MVTIEQILLVTAILLLVGIVGSKASSRLGVPALILFLMIGMVAGSDGPGGIPFNDPQTAQSIGVLALAFILFAGGLVCESGGVLSHGAILAREYGLPAVAGVPSATTTVQDGERLRVDGDRGVVERLDA